MQANLVASGTKRARVKRLVSHESSQQDAAQSHFPTDSIQSGSDEGSSSPQHSEEASPAATTVPVTSGPSTQRVEPACRASTRRRRYTGHDSSSGGAPTGTVASKQRVDPRRAPARPHSQGSRRIPEHAAGSTPSAEHSPSPVRGRRHWETAPGNSRRCTFVLAPLCISPAALARSAIATGGLALVPGHRRAAGAAVPPRRSRGTGVAVVPRTSGLPRSPPARPPQPNTWSGGFEEVNLLTLINYWV